MKKGIVMLVTFLAFISIGCSRQSGEEDVFHVLPERLKEDYGEKTTQAPGKVVRVEGNTVTIELYETAEQAAYKKSIEEPRTNNKVDFNESLQAEQMPENTAIESKADTKMDEETIPYTESGSSESSDQPVLEGSLDTPSALASSGPAEEGQLQNDVSETVEILIDDEILLKRNSDNIEESISPADLDPGQDIIVIFDEEGNILLMEALEE